MNLSPQQQHLLEVCRQKTIVLATGPRLSGKTIGCMNAIGDHAWQIPRARIAIVAIALTHGSDSGIWQTLVESALPGYMKDHPEMGWVDKPHQNSNKRWMCSVGNAHGGFSHIEMISVKDESEMERRFLARNYTMIYVPNLSDFKSLESFNAWIACLRGMGQDPSAFLLLADTNPPVERENSWAYKVWFGGERPKLNDQLAVVDFNISGNAHITPAQVDELKALYAHDCDLYERYILGKWTKSNG